MKLLILGGGDSPEREVSLRSAAAVAAAAKSAGFEVYRADPTDDWHALDKLDSSTIVLPILHGAGGEDGIVQLELEKHGLPFLGSDSTSSSECFDKWKTLAALKTAKIEVAKSMLVTKEDYSLSPLCLKPHVLKVRRGGSSIGTLVARDPSKLDQTQVDKLFELDDEAVLEELVEGIELTVPILDNKALPVIEIKPPEGLEFDYENKYNGASAEICPPQSVDKNLQRKAQEIAEQVHKIMGCRHLSRVDIMIDAAGQPYVLEINTMPGLTDQSLYPKSASVARITMPDLVRRFVGMVERDYKL